MLEKQSKVADRIDILGKQHIILGKIDNIKNSIVKLVFSFILATNFSYGGNQEVAYDNFINLKEIPKMVYKEVKNNKVATGLGVAEVVTLALGIETGGVFIFLYAINEIKEYITDEIAIKKRIKGCKKFKKKIKKQIDKINKLNTKDFLRYKYEILVLRDIYLRGKKNKYNYIVSKSKQDGISTGASPSSLMQTYFEYDQELELKIAKIFVSFIRNEKPGIKLEDLRKAYKFLYSGNEYYKQFF